MEVKVFLIGLLSGILGTFFINEIVFEIEPQVNQSEESFIGLPVDHKESQSVDDFNSNDFAALVAQNKLLSEKLEKLEAISTLPVSAQNTSPTQSVCDYSLIAELNNMGRLNNQSAEQLLSISEEGFAAEATDRTWAADYERSLQNMFRETDSIATYAPEQIECREKSCKVSLPAVDPSDQSSMSENLLKILANNSHGILGKASIFYDADQKKLMLYLARK
jgi:hypothetical protein